MASSAAMAGPFGHHPSFAAGIGAASRMSPADTLSGLLSSVLATSAAPSGLTLPEVRAWKNIPDCIREGFLSLSTFASQLSQATQTLAVALQHKANAAEVAESVSSRASNEQLTELSRFVQKEVLGRMDGPCGAHASSQKGLVQLGTRTAALESVVSAQDALIQHLQRELADAKAARAREADTVSAATKSFIEDAIRRAVEPLAQRREVDEALRGKADVAAMQLIVRDLHTLDGEIAGRTTREEVSTLIDERSTAAVEAASASIRAAAHTAADGCLRAVAEVRRAVEGKIGRDDLDTAVARAVAASAAAEPGAAGRGRRESSGPSLDGGTSLGVPFAPNAALGHGGSRSRSSSLGGGGGIGGPRYAPLPPQPPPQAAGGRGYGLPSQATAAGGHGAAAGDSTMLSSAASAAPTSTAGEPLTAATLRSRLAAVSATFDAKLERMRREVLEESRAAADAATASLTEAINKKAGKADVAKALDGKADRIAVEAALEGKAESSDVAASLRKKADAAEVAALKRAVVDVAAAAAAQRAVPPHARSSAGASGAGAGAGGQRLVPPASLLHGSPAVASPAPAGSDAADVALRRAIAALEAANDADASAAAVDASRRESEVAARAAAAVASATSASDAAAAANRAASAAAAAAGDASRRADAAATSAAGASAAAASCAASITELEGRIAAVEDEMTRLSRGGVAGAARNEALTHDVGLLSADMAALRSAQSRLEDAVAVAVTAAATADAARQHAQAQQLRSPAAASSTALVAAAPGAGSAPTPGTQVAPAPSTAPNPSPGPSPGVAGIGGRWVWKARALDEETQSVLWDVEAVAPPSETLLWGGSAAAAAFLRLAGSAAAGGSPAGAAGSELAATLPAALVPLAQDAAAASAVGRLRRCDVLAWRPGLYRISLGFFAATPPAISILVNGRPALSTAPHERVLLSAPEDADGAEGASDENEAILLGPAVLHKHPAGSVAGVSMMQFLALPARAVVSVLHDGAVRGQGFIELAKL